MNRKEFIKITGTSALMFGLLPNKLKALSNDDINITILHTNDVHSQIDPIPLNASKDAGMGGFARRSSLINKIRTSETNVLLFDAGDVFQGTPYFNIFKGELEYKLMSSMKYDAGTLGNHEFDYGINNIHDQLNNATFPILNTNYNFDNTILKGEIKTHKIFEKQGIKIGVYGLGPELKGLVDYKLYDATQYFDPIEKAQEIENLLKQKYNCNYIICLSHLGYENEYSTLNDIELAKNTYNTDLIIGGHSHTILNKPVIIFNKKQAEVSINQVGWRGLILGKINVVFNKNKEILSKKAYMLKILENQV